MLKKIAPFADQFRLALVLPRGSITAVDPLPLKNRKDPMGFLSIKKGGVISFSEPSLPERPSGEQS